MGVVKHMAILLGRSLRAHSGAVAWVGSVCPAATPCVGGYPTGSCSGVVPVVCMKIAVFGLSACGSWIHTYRGIDTAHIMHRSVLRQSMYMTRRTDGVVMPE